MDNSIINDNTDNVNSPSGESITPSFLGPGRFATGPVEIIKSQIKCILLKHEGSSNPISAKQLSTLLHKDERIIRILIRELITDGLPVASLTTNPSGYFIVTNLYEANRYAESIKGRLIEDALRRRDFKKSASLYLQQEIQGRLL